MATDAPDVDALIAERDRLRRRVLELERAAGAAARPAADGEDRFAHLFRHSPYSIMVATYPEGRIVDANPACLRLFGFEHDAIVGRTTGEINLWSDSADRAIMVERLRTGQPVERMEFSFRGADGINRSLLLSVVLFDLDGQPHSLAMSIDVTERRRVEDVVRRQAVLLEAIMAGTADAITIKDRDGRYQLANPAAERLLGHPVAAVLGRTDHELLGADAAARLGPLDQAVMTSGQPHDGEVPLVLASRQLTLRAQIAPWRDGGGHIIGVVTVASDISEQRRLEASLRQAHKLEALGTLAAGIAHDFNNILTAISAHASLLAHRLGDVSAVAEDLAGIDRSASRATALIRQILTFGRQQAEDRRVHALAPVVSEALDLLRATLPTTIVLDARVDDPHSLVNADPTRVHQVVVNLGTNAAHAMRERGGVLQVEQSVVDGSTVHDGSWPTTLARAPHVRLVVRDSGHGMDEATARRVFDPFFTTKSPAEGTGLGLAVAHGIMRGLDGDITIDSVPGVGTTVTLYFPRVTGHAARTPAPRPAATGQGQRVMLVDDEAPLVQVGVRMLHRLGYRATGFGSGPEALAALHAEPDGFDVVVTDLTMPGMTGVELVRAIAAVRPGLPCVLTSGYAPELTAERLTELGVRALVAKPFTGTSLAEAITRALAG